MKSMPRGEEQDMKALTLFGSAGLGAGLMYLFDPDKGRRRRALLRDQANRATHGFDASLRTGLSDARHRLQGLAAESAGLFAGDLPSDDVLAERARSKIGRAVSHPAAIGVSVKNRRVTLRGPVLASEVEELLCAASSVRGVV